MSELGEASASALQSRSCIGCAQAKPETDDYFVPMRTKPGHFHGRCRDCKNESARHRWAARRRATGVACACGCGGFPPSLNARYIIGHFRPIGRLGTILSAPARSHPTALDIAWAAGIYEGEGSAGYSGVSVGQRDTWILERLRDLFGGTVRYDRSVELWYWYVSGARGRGFLMTVYMFLSPWRREQARRAIATLGTHPGRRRTKRPRPKAFPHRRRRSAS